MWDLLISPIVGAIGGITTQIISYKTHKIDLEDKDKARTHEREMTTIRHAQAIELTKAEQEGIERTLSLKGDIDAVNRDLDNLGVALGTVPKWSGAMESDGVYLRWFKTLVEALQMLARAAVTIYLTYKLADLSNRAIVALERTPITFSEAQAGSIYLLIVRGMVELAGLAIGFWFGSRGAQLVQQRKGIA